MPGYRLKRLFDIVLALLLLAVVTPLLCLAVLLIFFDGQHKPLFLQRRLGLNGKEFTMFKFRTMRSPSAGMLHTKPAAPELTHIGRFLRNTGMDELPQLFNVLKGDMSMIGPRPHALAFAEHYAEIHPRYYERYNVRPGMVCITEITALHYLTEDDKHIRMRINCDLYYIRRLSPVLDFKIFIKVVRYVLKQARGHHRLPGAAKYIPAIAAADAKAGSLAITPAARAPGA